MVTIEKAKQLSRIFADTAVDRDQLGGTPKQERDLIRQSGLLSLTIPTELGGLGASWQEAMTVIREIAKGDSSLGHVFGFQHLMLATVRLFSAGEQWERLFEQTAKFNWFWGNALNPLDERTVARDFGYWREFSGQKSFCSGATDSEMLIASALDDKTRKLLISALPTLRTGISVMQDWNNIGQRQTDSGSVTFEKVRVEENELLMHTEPLSTPFSSLRPLVAQLILTNVYLGIAEGAFDEAKNYSLKEARPWFTSGVEQANQDPYYLMHYGKFWVGLEASRSLADKAAEKLDKAWKKQTKLKAGERGELAVAIASAKVMATETGLQITNKMFEVMGSRSTHAGLRLDRYWRNLRTHTLHDPIDYKIKELGDWALNTQYPRPTFYS